MKVIDAEFAGEIASGCTFYDDDYGSFRFVASQEVSQHRWYVKRLIVFTFDTPDLREAPSGDLLGFYYLDPASELQEGQDRFEADPVPVFRVVGKDVVTTVYEAA